MRGWLRPLNWLSRAWQYFFSLSFSSLTRRIVSLNLAGLVALVAVVISRLRAAKDDRTGRLEAEASLAGAESLAAVLADEEARQTRGVTAG